MTVLDTTIITSRDNPQVKRLAALLAHKKDRQSENAFVCEGARLCLDAVAAGHKPRGVYLTRDAADKHPDLAALTQATGQVVWLDPQLAARIADTRNTQGVFAVFDLPVQTALPERPDGSYLLLDSIQDPGNLGAMLRTAAALGVTGVLMSGCAELFSPKVLRASMGGVLRVPVLTETDMPSRITALKGAGIAVWAAALRDGAQPVRVLRGAGGRAVLIGNEGAGLLDSLIDACDGCVRIDMAAGVESLNAAVAAGILMWEMTRGDG